MARLEVRAAILPQFADNGPMTGENLNAGMERLKDLNEVPKKHIDKCMQSHGVNETGQPKFPPDGPKRRGAFPDLQAMSGLSETCCCTHGIQLMMLLH